VAEILGGLVVLTKRADDKYVPVVKSLSMDFKRPALSGIYSQASFSDHNVGVVKLALESTGRYDFDLGSILCNEQGEVVAEAKGCYAVRTMA
jgi:acyl-CoA thioesterase FadM